MGDIRVPGEWSGCGEAESGAGECLSTPWSELNINVTTNCLYHIGLHRYIYIRVVHDFAKV